MWCEWVFSGEGSDPTAPLPSRPEVLTQSPAGPQESAFGRLVWACSHTDPWQDGHGCGSGGDIFLRFVPQPCLATPGSVGVSVVLRGQGWGTDFIAPQRTRNREGRGGVS